MNPKLIGRCTGETYASEVWEDTVTQKVVFTADADIDSDGGSNPDHDPDWNPDTSLHHNGKPIDAETVPGAVVPLWLPNTVKGIVLGCQGKATNTVTGQSSPFVTHDKGPKNKDGEITPELARRIGVNPNSVSGGCDANVILYELYPGIAAVVDGIEYTLKPA